MILRAVIDTNVLVSALLSSKNTAATVQVLERMIAGEIIPLYSELIMKEYQEVLRREKFGFSSQRIAYMLSFVERFGILVQPKAINITLPDMKDVPFYETVMEKRIDGAYLVTGNMKHFPEKPYIVTPKQLLDMMDG